MIDDSQAAVHGLLAGYACEGLRIDDLGILSLGVFHELTGKMPAWRDLEPLRYTLRKLRENAELVFQSANPERGAPSLRGFLQDVDSLEQECIRWYRADLETGGAEDACAYIAGKLRDRVPGEGEAAPNTPDLSEVSAAVYRWQVGGLAAGAPRSPISPLIDDIGRSLRKMTELGICSSNTARALSVGRDLLKTWWKLLDEDPSVEPGEIHGLVSSAKDLLTSDGREELKELKLSSVTKEKINSPRTRMRLEKLRQLLLSDLQRQAKGEAASVGAGAVVSRPPREVLEELETQTIGAKSSEELKELGFCNFVAVSESSRRAATHAHALLLKGGPIFLMGPPGTGKELLARDLTDIASGVKDASVAEFLTVSAADLSGEVGWATLVGVRAGAGTNVTERKGLLEIAADLSTERQTALKKGEMNKPVVFIDEIHSADLNTQDKLLRVLDPAHGTYTPLGHKGPPEKVKATLVVATSESLWERVGARTFRRALLDRVKDGLVWIPPLWERPEDPAAIYEKMCSDLGRKVSLSRAERRDLATLVAEQYEGGRFILYRVQRYVESSPGVVSPRLTDVFSELLGPRGQRDTRAELLRSCLEQKGRTLTDVACDPRFYTAEDKRIFNAGTEEEKQRRRYAIRRRLDRECRKLGILHDRTSPRR